MALTAFIPPWLEILLISAGLSIVLTLVYKYTTDQALMRELKKEQKKLQDQMKDVKDPEKLAEINKKLTPLSLRYFKHSMKPTLITLIPFIIIFWWLKGVYNTAVVIPLSFWPGHLGWIGTYIIFSMIFTTLFRKLLKVA